MTKMRISGKGWVVIPSHLRKKRNIKPGDQVAIIDYGGVLSIVPLAKDPIKAGKGMLRGGRSLSEALLEKRAKERAREERR